MIHHINADHLSIAKVEEMLKEENIPSFEYIPFRAEKKNDFNFVACSGCNQAVDPYLVIPVGKKVFCPECSVTKIDWCKKCGAPYVIKNKDKHKCSPKR